MREGEMRQISSLIARAVRTDPAAPGGDDRTRDLHDEVAALVAKFPAYPR
jgi:glycine hydroxymethyltransferase